PLNSKMMMIRKVRCPVLHCRTILHRLRHGLRKASFASMATDRTDFDRGAMRRHLDPDRRQIEHLALFIAYRLDILQGRLTMPTAGDLMRDDPLRILCCHQRLALLARLATIGLVTRLPQAGGPLRFAIAVA